ncbi:UNVERIFIED_ORG: 2-hydroxy-3-oxopropionate reductase [Clostridium botulinum]|uniref:NAD(P)-dependent oxidoreductase n=1 Tax=Clostridium botulinum TaxID=1491 RepID=UPI000174E615|nr:NAD(P)-binding domain-containing protein [Clostridium botulinum]ACD52889.1 putative 2-hydroxy-3-oxopropionate reductase [Clostridium botulinum E3 str. Alaska E43]AJF30288.1 2-hydroxy-3-oxopropionate reductase [Clostridium botulinum]AJF33351.1 2-hydroxy-3-oxopropionate reductase [Clostridium botulinum]MBN1062453.1 NAD(P)-dependent oxidoreductase [Clostridium botulinum]MBY6788506.1 NAD(P)-dependent oxidoreductase [Clostridium botulinum]
MKIAVLGTGRMGTGLTEGLINAGHETIIYNRTADKTVQLKKLGAKVAATPAEAIKEADVTIIVVVDGIAVRDILLNNETKAVLKGKKILNAATTGVDEVIDIAKEVAELGGDLGETSILVGAEQLANNEGKFLVGCNDKFKTLWMNVLGSIGVAYHVGEVGNASKAETPMLFGSLFMGMTAAYSAAVAIKLNVPQEIIAQQLSMVVPGAEYLVPGMMARDYSEVMASVEAFKGVADSAIRTTKSLGVPTKIIEDVFELYEEADKRGFGSQDGTSIIEVLLDQKADNN